MTNNDLDTLFLDSQSITRRVDQSSIDLQALIARAVAACAKARRHAIVSRHDSEQQLRAIRDAGGLLSLVQRSRGGRRRRNASIELTSYQVALKRAGISRQTAGIWRHVADIPMADFERYISDTQHTRCDRTIAELFRYVGCSSKSHTNSKTLTLTCGDAEYEAFVHQVQTLRAAYRSSTTTEALMLAIRRVHAEWLAAQTDGRHLPK